MSSAVLIPLYVAAGTVHVLFTKRSELVEHHKGQISFPGGAEDETDPDLRFTALRETYEEIGVYPRDVDILGQMDDFITITNFRVRPYVGIIEKWPYEFVYDGHEVAEILEVPFAHLLEERNRRDESRDVGGRSIMMRTYHWGDHAIWGATAFMLRHFLEVLESGGCLDELVSTSLRR